METRIEVQIVGSENPALAAILDEADEALRQSEQRHQTDVESQTELVCRFLPDTTLTFVNQAYACYFGKSVEDLIDQSFLNSHSQGAT